MSGDQQFGPWVITIELDRDTPDGEAEEFINAVADTAMSFEPRTGWDPHMVASKNRTDALTVPTADGEIRIGHGLGVVALTGDGKRGPYGAAIAADEAIALGRILVDQGNAALDAEDAAENGEQG